MFCIQSDNTRQLMSEVCPAKSASQCVQLNISHLTPGTVSGALELIPVLRAPCKKTGTKDVLGWNTMIMGSGQFGTGKTGNPP